MANAGSAGDRLLRVAYWASLSVIILNGVLSLTVLLGGPDLRAWWGHVLVVLAAVVMIAIAAVPGWWGRARPPRK